jgi:probable HAF family extracellular repeat protein
MPAATPARCRRRAPGKEGIMHATLSPSWKKSLLLVFVSVVAFAAATPATSGPQCFFQGLGFLPGDNRSQANGVNANGTVVVGQSIVEPAPVSRGQAFRWTAASGMVGLGFGKFGFASTASGVNADGTVVVGTSVAPPRPREPPRSEAFRWTAASGMVGLGHLPGSIESLARGVNADGTVVVGTSVALPLPSARTEAFRWTAASGMVGLGFLPGGNFSEARGVNADGTVVVGSSSGQAFRWVNGTMTGLGFLSSGGSSGASGVNAGGTIVVGSSSGQAFRWVNGTMVGLDFLPGGNFSEARGVNANGKVVVGEARDASGQSQAFRWTRATRMQSVLTLLQAAGVVTMAGWQLRSANGVSADGTVIAGDGVDPVGQFQGWIARLPKEDNEDCEEDDRS